MKTTCHRNYRVSLMGCSPLPSIPDLGEIRKQDRLVPQRKSRFPGFFILRASYRNRGAQLVLIFEAAAALGCFARLGSSRMAARFTFFTSDTACLEPRLCAAYSWPSTGATCGGSLPRYGRPIPNSFPCASTHFQCFSEEAHRWSRVPPWTLTISAASPCP
jgi:hypothetical protein